MAGSDTHLKPIRLFDIARHSGRPVTEEEKEHLRSCEQCQRMIEVFARQRFDPPDPNEKTG